MLNPSSFDDDDEEDDDDDDDGYLQQEKKKDMAFSELVVITYLKQWGAVDGRSSPCAWLCPGRYRGFK